MKHLAKQNALRSNLILMKVRFATDKWNMGNLEADNEKFTWNGTC